MTYYNYLFTILGILLLAWVGARWLARSPTAADDNIKPVHKRSQLTRRQAESMRQTRDRIAGVSSATSDLTDIKTPWGWPGSATKPLRRQYGAAGNDAHRRPASSMMSRWIEGLVAEKQTVDNQEYRLRKDASLRTMLEDRYGQAGDAQAAGVAEFSPGSGLDKGDPGASAINLSRIKNLKSPKGW